MGMHLPNSTVSSVKVRTLVCNICVLQKSPADTLLSECVLSKCAILEYHLINSGDSDSFLVSFYLKHIINDFNMVYGAAVAFNPC